MSLLCRRSMPIRAVRASLPALWVLFALLAGSDGVQGQVFRCERDGQVSFSDQACDTGAKSTKKDYATATTSGSLEMRVTVNHYPVEGQNYAALMGSMTRNGPNGYHGLARWKVDREFRYQRDGQTCKVVDVKMAIVGDILMPKWVDMATAPRDLQRRWLSSYSALMRHEDGHIQHGRELGLLVKEKLMGLGAMACDRIEAVADAEYRRIFEQLKGRDAQYDLRTRHGLTQGTEL